MELPSTKEIIQRQLLRAQIGEFEGSVNVESEKYDLWWLYELWRDGKVGSLETFLQRPLLEKIWLARERQKSNEFLTSAVLGTSLLEGYILAPASLVMDELKTWLKNETDKSVIEQLKECKRIVSDKMKNGIVWFILDGQTRSKTTIVPFFENEFSLPQSGVSGKQLRLRRYDELKDVLVNGKLFKDLNNDTQLMLKSTPVRIDIIVSGSLQGVVSALIAKQLNVSWTDFQKLYIGSYISAFANRIISTMSQPNVDFLIKCTTVATAKNFKQDINGIEFFHSILLNYFQNDVVSKVTDTEFINKFAPGGNNIQQSKCDELNNFYKELIEWSGINNNFAGTYGEELATNGKVKIDIIRNYFVLRWAMHTKKCQSIITQHIEDLTILSANGFVDWFIKKHLTLIAKFHKIDGKKVVNTDSWLPDETAKVQTEKTLTKKQSGYAMSTTSMTKDNFDKALAYLLVELEKDQDELISKNIIVKTVDMVSKEELLVTENFKDRHGKHISSKEILNPLHDRGHTNPQADGGSNEELVIQEHKENQQYNKRPLINTLN